MCCITRCVIKHFYGEGCKRCGLIPHCAHSEAHFACLHVCACDSGGVGVQCTHSELLNVCAVVGGLSSCLCVHLGGLGLFSLNVPLVSYLNTMGASLCCKRQVMHIWDSGDEKMFLKFSCSALPVCAHRGGWRMKSQHCPLLDVSDHTSIQ